MRDGALLIVCSNVVPILKIMPNKALTAGVLLSCVAVVVVVIQLRSLRRRVEAIQSQTQSLQGPSFDARVLSLVGSQPPKKSVTFASPEAARDAEHPEPSTEEDEEIQKLLDLAVKARTATSV